MINYEDLAFLASESAIAIDSHIKGRVKEKDYSNVEELANKLDKFSKEQLDPIGLLMLAEVIWPNNKDLMGKREYHVYRQTNRLAKDLACFREFPKEKQEELRDVCVELSKKSKYYSIPDRIGLTV